MEKRTSRIIAGVVIVACIVYFGFSLVRNSLLGSFVAVVFDSENSSEPVVVGDPYQLYSRASELNSQITQITTELVSSDEITKRSVVGSNYVALISKGFDDSEEILGSKKDSSDKEDKEFDLSPRIPCSQPDCDPRDRGGLRDLSDVPDVSPDEPSQNTSDSSSLQPAESSGSSSAAPTDARNTERIERIESKRASVEKLNTLVSERHELMTALAKSNPELFLSSQLSVEVLKKLPRSLQHEVEKPVFLKGFVVPMKNSSYFVSKNEILTLYSTNGVQTNSISAIQLSGVRIGNLVVAESADIKKISPFFMNKGN